MRNRAVSRACLQFFLSITRSSRVLEGLVSRLLIRPNPEGLKFADVSLRG